MRERPDDDPEAVLIISTVGAAERRKLRGRRGRTLQEASPTLVPTSRATVAKPQPFADPDAATAWLSALRDDPAARSTEIDDALRVLNRALHAHRVSRGDPYARDVSAEQAIAVRLGFGTGDEAVDGRYSEAWELPASDSSRIRRSMEAPDERFAAVLGAREPVLACEELILRARMDLDGGRPREAALQARVALEALLAEVSDIPGDRRGPLENDRGTVGDAANAALKGDLEPPLEEDLRRSVGRMESALRAYRVSGSSV